VDIPNTVLSISDYAFYSTEIEQVRVPDSVTTIGDHAFYGSDTAKLISISIGTGVSEIGDHAFPLSLVSFKLEKSNVLINWGTEVFSLSEDWYRDYYLQIVKDGVLDQTKLVRGHVYSTNKDLPDTSYDISKDQDGSLFASYDENIRSMTILEMEDRDSFTMMDFTYDDSDPESVTDNRGWAGYLSSIDEVIFTAEHLTNVGDNMLRGITQVTTLSLPDAIRKIGDHAFFGMTALETISLSRSLESIGSYALADTVLTSVDLPSSLVTIGDHAFVTSTLKGFVTIPNSVISVGDYAFYRTTNSATNTISAVVIGSSVSEIGDYAFAGHGAIATVLIRGSSGSVLLGDHVFSTYDSSEPAVYSDLQFKLDGEGEAQALTSSVEKGTFWIIDGSSALKLGSNINAYVADGFVFISGSGDFYSLDDVSFTDKDAWLDLEVKEIVISGVTNIGTSTGAADLFQQSNVTSNLTSLSLYDAVKIPAGAFSSCSGLVHIAIPVAAFAPTVGYSPVIFSMGADAFYLAALDSIDTVSNEGVWTFELAGDYRFEQAGNLIIVKNAVWQDSKGNWTTSFQDGGSYRPTELSGYVSNGYTASLTTTM
jgi:hypothetical protein